MSKGLIVFIIVAVVALAATMIIKMKKSADDAHKQSDEILKEFKTIDNSLKESANRIDSSNQKLQESLPEKFK